MENPAGVPSRGVTPLVYKLWHNGPESPLGHSVNRRQFDDEIPSEGLCSFKRFSARGALRALIISHNGKTFKTAADTLVCWPLTYELLELVT